jgi:RNA polymerase sigma-70 factor (ECF subfamily)
LFTAGALPMFWFQWVGVSVAHSRLSCNDSIAREITQQTFFKALEKSKKLSDDANVFSWLCQIAKNTYIDYLRKEKRTESIENIEDISEEGNLEQKYCEKEHILKIHEQLHRLNEPYKEVCMLRVFGELSYREIGKIFNKTENWARVTYFRAKVQIQEGMEGYCNE